MKNVEKKWFKKNEENKNNQNIKNNNKAIKNEEG